jgi:hypothetical protein
MMAARSRRHNGFVAPTGAAAIFLSTEFSSALLSFSLNDPIIEACSTKRKEVIRCRVVSVSRAWLGRIVLSGSSLPDSDMKRGR